MQIAASMKILQTQNYTTGLKNEPEKHTNNEEISEEVNIQIILISGISSAFGMSGTLMLVITAATIEGIVIRLAI